MRKTLIPIALAMLATAAAAQDVRQEDRREDRQADRRMEPNDVRREDRQADRRAGANEVEVKLEVPRNADGTINETQLASDIKARLAAGATEIQVRGLTAQDAKALIAPFVPAGTIAMFALMRPSELMVETSGCGCPVANSVTKKVSRTLR